MTTPLGKDTLVLVEFDGDEWLGQLFKFRIEALSDERDIDFDAAIGQNCCVTYKSHDRERHFSGILTEARWLGPRNDRFAYSLVLRPWFWLLTKTTDCRIFEKMNVKEIIKKVFTDRGFKDFDDKATGNYDKIEYCVQYRETDKDFVSRLMEQYGIYYFFEHTSDKHTLVMADSRSSHDDVPGLATLPFIALDGADARAGARLELDGRPPLSDREDRAQGLRLHQAEREAAVGRHGSAGYTHSDMEIYDYPGKYKEQDEGDRFAKIRLEAEQAVDQRRSAEGDASSLFPGGLTSLQGQVKPSENVQYLILGASHALRAGSYRSGGDLPPLIYTGRYDFLPADRPFRSPLKTPRPFVHGPQTAKVVGKSGEEIDVDEHGRILVQFYWDRKKMQSCRVRIAQVWSGKNWGGIFIPRIDQEVVVEFLEGNPDRPMVTGTVYNGDNKVPYKLPDNKTKAGWKTDSSKGHGGYNEIVFEDKKGEEDIGVHAQKDLDIEVLNKESRKIGQDFLPPMGSASRETVLQSGDDDLTLSTGNQNLTIALGTQTTFVMQTITTTAGLGMTFTVGLSVISITPASITIQSPVINLLAETSINITAPIVQIVGVTTINGMLPVTIPVPV